jgi:DNA-binding MarR family transcriptional regulator
MSHRIASGPGWVNSGVTRTVTVQYGKQMPAAPFDPIAEAHRQWSARWPEQADHMAAVTSVMRVQQLLLSRIEDTLKPYGLTFAAYEALRLLAFSRRGSLPMGKMGERLMVHPASVTNAISRLEQRGLVERRLSPTDRRVVLATITATGQSVVREATDALNQASFGVPRLSPEQAADITTALRQIRAAADDLPTEPAEPIEPVGAVGAEPVGAEAIGTETVPADAPPEPVPE